MVVLLTTSHRPSPRIRSFCSDIESSSDLFIHVARGKQTQVDLVSLAKACNADCIMLVCSTKGNPGKIDMYQIHQLGLVKKLSLILKGVKLTREMGVRVSKLRRRPVLVTATKQEEVLKVASAFAKLIGAPLVLNGFLSIGLNIAFRSGIKELMTINFLDAASNTPCGPLIRVKSFYIW